MDQQEFDNKYINLCTGIDCATKKKYDGIGDIVFIDGPDDMKQRAEELEKVPSASELCDLSAELKGAVLGRDSAIEDSRRRAYLVDVLSGLNTFTEVLKGDVPYTEVVKSCYRMEPREVPEDQMTHRFRRLNDALPGKGSIQDRFMEWRGGQDVPPKEVEPLLRKLIEETRARTKGYLDLPEGERVEIKVVKRAAWAGYNTYGGNGVSRISINIQYPVTVTRLIGIGTHESYPGHHVEHALKEQNLGNNGIVEETVLTYFTPRCPISEGVAMNGENIIFDDGLRGALEWYNDNTKGEMDVDTAVAVMNANIELVHGARENAALMLHSKKRDRESVRNYLGTWLEHSPNLVDAVMSFIDHPIYGPYVFNYRGGRIIEEAYRNALSAGVPKNELVERLYTDQLRPGTLWHLSDPV
jgi:hypothetical protein